MIKKIDEENISECVNVIKESFATVANEWQIDHINPRSRGGSNSNSNAQVLSRQENRIKSDSVE